MYGPKKLDNSYMYTTVHQLHLPLYNGAKYNTTIQKGHTFLYIHTLVAQKSNH